MMPYRLSARSLLGLALLAAACAGMARNTAPAPTACSLLTGSDVERVQGGSLKEAVPSGAADQPISTTQCFFRVEPFTSSVSLTLTRASGGGSARREVDERWQRMFHPEQRRGATSARGERDEHEEKERKVSPTPVANLGEEALLSFSRGNVSLYVKARGAYLSLSVGGPGKPEDWSRRAEALARSALDRL